MTTFYRHDHWRVSPKGVRHRVSGSWVNRDDWERSAGWLRVWTYADPEDSCHPTKCPRCGVSVYFVRHNGGSVWLDDLGWPWPRHECFEDDPYIAGIRTNAQSLTEDMPRMGQVVGCALASTGVLRLQIRLFDSAMYDGWVFGTRLTGGVPLGSLVIATHVDGNRVSLRLFTPHGALDRDLLHLASPAEA